MKNLYLILAFIISISFLNQSVAHSNCIEGDCKNGPGTYYYNVSKGEKYRGQWKDGQRHGQGQQTYEDGSIFSGEWEFDQEREGTLLRPDGTKYKGGVLNGKDMVMELFSIIMIELFLKANLMKI